QLLKQNLQPNLTKLAKLKGHKGRKLTFDTKTGRFGHADGLFALTVGNRATLTSMDELAPHILVTMSECKKLCLKPTVAKLLLATEHLGNPPAVAFKNSLDGLESHLQLTHPFDLNPKTEYETNRRRQPYTQVINRAHQLWGAPDRRSIDQLIGQWFEINLYF